MANNEPFAIQDVFPVSGIRSIDFSCHSCEFFLFLCKRYTPEYAVVTAAETIRLVLCEMLVLRHFNIIHSDITRNAFYEFLDFRRCQAHRTFCDYMALAVSDKDFNRNLGIVLVLVRKVNYRSRNSVCHLIGMTRVYFFKHCYFLLVLSNLSIKSSCGFAPE